MARGLTGKLPLYVACYRKTMAKDCASLFVVPSPGATAGQPPGERQGIPQGNGRAVIPRATATAGAAIPRGNGRGRHPQGQRQGPPSPGQRQGPPSPGATARQGRHPQGNGRAAIPRGNGRAAIPRGNGRGRLPGCRAAPGALSWVKRMGQPP